MVKKLFSVIAFLFLSVNGVTVLAQNADLKLGLPLGHRLQIIQMACSQNGDFIATVDEDYTIYIWDAKSGYLLQKLEGHSARISSIEFHPDGVQLLTASDDQSLRLWNVATGKLLSVLGVSDSSKQGKMAYGYSRSPFDINWDTSVPPQHEGEIYEAMFSRNGEKIISLHEDHTIRVWNAFTHQLMLCYQYADPTGVSVGRASARLSNDGSFFLCAFQNEEAIWEDGSPVLARVVDANSGELLSEIKLNEAVNGLEISADNSFFLLQFKSGKTRLYRNQSGNAIITIPKMNPLNHWHRVCFADSGKHIYSYGPRAVYYWESETSKLLDSIALDGVRMVDVSLTSFGSKLAITLSSGKAFVYDPKSVEKLTSLSLSSQQITEARLILGASQLITTTTDACQIWDLNTNKLLSQFDVLSKVNPVGKLLLNESSNLLLTVPGQLDFPVINAMKLEDGRIVSRIVPERQNIVCSELTQAGNQLLLSSWNRRVHLREIQTTSVSLSLEHPTEVNEASIVPNKDRLVTVDVEDELRIWHSKTGELLKTIHLEAPPHSIAISDQFCFIKDRDNHLKAWDLSSYSLVHSQWSKSLYPTELVLAPTHDFIAGTTIQAPVNDSEVWSGMLQYLNVEVLRIDKVPFELSYTFSLSSSSFIEEEDVKLAFNQQGTLLAVSFNDGDRAVVEVHDIRAKKKLGRLESPASVFAANLLHFTHENSLIIAKGNRELVLWNVLDSQDDQHIKTYAFQSEIADLKSYKASDEVELLLIASRNGTISLFDLKKFKPVISAYFLGFDKSAWVHLHPSGLFDASPIAMEWMYWLKGDEIIDFSQLKDRYWVPGLWEKTLSGEELPSTRGLNELKLHPKADIKKIENGKAHVVLNKREGGYGAVSFLINGKEVSRDVRGTGFDTGAAQQEVVLDLRNHPYLQSGENTIEVIPSSADGFMQGRGAKARYIYKAKETQSVSFYSVVVGVGSYNNPAMNLKYTVPDAEAISKAVQLGAEGLFGKENTHVYTITSGSQLKPTKETIRRHFEMISKRAKAQDVILVYLSGHGLSWGQELGEFFFLTSDATSTSSLAFADKALRSAHAISTLDLTEWLKEIAALKQVMIIDACGSGQAVENLLASRSVDAAQIKAIDRMKDRTGMYVISGCAADAVSYEASQYGQGLLTYALLQGMKGAGLREDRFVDIGTLLSHARDQVPQLARGIGGIQEPQLLIPRSGSFDIGILPSEKRAAIPLAQPKPIFVRSVFQDEDEFEDVLGLSKEVDLRLNEISAKGPESEIIFFDVREYSNACKITGRYTRKGQQIRLDYKLKCGEDSRKKQIIAENKKDLIDRLIDDL